MFGGSDRSPLTPPFYLPDHLHTLWTLPEGDADFSGRWRAIKAPFSRGLVRRGVPLVRDRRGEYDLWQWRFRERLVRANDDFADASITVTITR